MLDEAIHHIREAIMLGRTDILKKLLEEVKSTIKKDHENEPEAFSAFINENHGQLGTYLHEAVKHGKKDVVRALLQEGADPGAFDESNESSVDVIATDEMAQVFADVLFQATAAGNHDQLEGLLRSGMSVSTLDTVSTKNTPLHWAAAFGNSQTAKLLLENFGADANQTNAEGATPLHDAVLRGDVDLVRVMVKAGGNPHVVATAGKSKQKSPLDLAEHNEQLKHVLVTSTYQRETPVTMNGDDHNEAPLDRVQRHFSGGAMRISPVPPVITDERLNLLWPQPKLVQQLSQILNVFPHRMSLSVSPGKHSVHDILDVWDTHRGMLGRLHRRVHLSENHPRPNKDTYTADDCTIFCSISAKLLSITGGYRLTVNDNKIRIQAADMPGLHYAIVTLAQLFALYYPDPKMSKKNHDEKDDEHSNSNSLDANDDEGIVSVQICDQPDMAMRAMLLDLNPYGRVPKLEVLLSTIDVWASIKVNQFHAFIRVGTSDQAALLCYTKSDFLTIDRYCRDRFMDFIPAFDVDNSVHSIDQLDKLRPKFAEIMSCFDQPCFVHLGPKLTSLLMTPPSWKDKECTLRNLFPVSDVTTFILCGNSLQASGVGPRSVPAGVMVMHYGFQRDEAFTNALSGFNATGLSVGICSGTNAWSNLSGNPSVALYNASSAAKSIHRYSGVGMTTAHWSSHPSLAHLSFAWPGFLAGAGVAWNTETPIPFVQSVIHTLIDVLVLGHCGFTVDGRYCEEDQNGSAGKALVELGLAEAALDRQDHFHQDARGPPDTTLLKVLVTPDDVALDRLKVEDFAVAVQHVKRAQAHLNKCKPTKNVRVQSVRQELHLTSELLLLSARIGRALLATGVNPHESGGVAAINVGVANLPPTFRTDIANKLLGLVEQYRALWLSRYEPQGLQASLLVLSDLLTKFIPDSSQLIM